MESAGLQSPGIALRHTQSQHTKSFYDKILPPIDNSDASDPRSRYPPRHRHANAVNAPASDQSVPSLETTDNSPSTTQSRESAGIHTATEDRQRNGSRCSSPASGLSSDSTPDTELTSTDLPPLQNKSLLEDSDRMEPLSGDLQGSFDLVAPPSEDHYSFSLEKRSELLFSREHLSLIFATSSSLLQFTAFLSTYRPQAVPVLIFYLDALKALRAIEYSNAIVDALRPIEHHPYTEARCRFTQNKQLEEKADAAFQSLTDHDLPAYITHLYILIVSLSISRRITGALAPHLRDASEGLAEVFCLTDPSRPDNPIVFASEEFNRTTQYGLSYVLGRNCRFLQGPKTNALSVRRLREAVEQGRDHCEVFLNYRRDGSPFMNMLMIAPLRDSRGKIRYFIGAQVDVSGLVKDCTDLDSLRKLVQEEPSKADDTKDEKDHFRELSEMLNMTELETIRKHGGGMHREIREDDPENTLSKASHMPRLLLQEPQPSFEVTSQTKAQSGKLSGIYQNYLLIRPFPSFRILFASPTLRIPGILQSPFLDKIGGSGRVRDELSAALAGGRGVTAKVRWLPRYDEDGRNRWIHCTPLIGSNGQIGVWMVVLVDEDEEINRRWKKAPPVAGPHRGKVFGSSIASPSSSIEASRAKASTSMDSSRSVQKQHNDRPTPIGAKSRPATPNSVRI